MMNDKELSVLVTPYSWGKKWALGPISQDTLGLREIDT
jgi:hypothetical protein